MLNIFYWYSIIWTITLVLYGLPWSNYNKEICGDLICFFLVSIIISFLLGFLFRKKFKYKSLSRKPKISRKITILIIVISLIEFLYSQNIPFLSILIGNSNYGDFQGVPVIHSLLENLMIFYSSYLFYVFLETNNKTFLIEFATIIFMLLLMFHKGAIFLCLFICINLYVVKLRQKKKIFTIKKILVLSLSVFLILYINGGLTNIRSGVNWNDNELISSVARINQNWPCWLPKQFGWAYSYITTPLVNLNNNLLLGRNSVFINRLAITIMPIAISKRLFPTLIVQSNEIFLINPLLNACTGFIDAVVSGGIIGMYTYYILYIFITLFIIYFRGKNRYSTIFYANMDMLIAFMFFYNTLSNAGTSLIIFYILLFPYSSNIKFKFNSLFKVEEEFL